MASLVHLARNPRYPTYEKLDQDEGSPAPARRERVKAYGPSRSQRRCLIYSTIVFVISSVFGYILLVLTSSHTTGALDQIALTIGLHRNIYAVIIDAGSTGSRVLALSFHQSKLDDSLKVDEELFVEQKPGLSAFSDDPDKGAQKINELLTKAREFVPQHLWAETPLVLRATAGLRLLPGDKAKRILDAVKLLFGSSGFKTTKNSVDIMDGSQEGLFAWVTVNFLLDKLFGSPNQMLAALDLGGGSTQISFPLEEDNHSNKYDADDIHAMKMFGQTISVYTHSYLELGLMAARKAILSKGNAAGATELASECVNPINKNKIFKYGGVEYLVSGPLKPEILKKKRKDDSVIEEIPIVRIKECSELVKEHIRSRNVTKPEDLLNFEITAFSYFFERATEVGLIDPFSSGRVSLKELKKAATDSCMDPNVEMPFICIDLLFITILLEDGYGLKSDSTITLVNKLDGHEVSWSLGAAFHYLQNGL